MVWELQRKTSIKQRLAIIGAQGALPPGNSRPQARLGIFDNGPMALAERFGTRLGDDEIGVLGDLLEKILQYQPQDRIKMCREVVAHRWFDHK